ncbi:helix-turn-helix transcriptional regulator [Rhodospirillaceae bacterium KN72]|uniref:Helix-turn-helix transcriptional regulator n=1 Tax=Pacificispira spongiicola TaxID=2729598 RepID=A0A7Y0DWI1_9PROT|nr:XRE family transcriptional regulator [Pacificispira spongiicola]NMM42910.1 helix-turn-helix transcriptional regulator [Pacificispira spongiicola]
METSLSIETSIDTRLAERLRLLRMDRGWTLDDLAKRSGVSRATLSRLENGEVSPTTTVLGRLCAAHGMTLSRLMILVEGDTAPLIPQAAQTVWTDPETGYVRRVLSPPGGDLSGEVIEATLPPACRIDYDAPPRPGLEHHLVLLDGMLTVTLDGTAHRVAPGDCLRYRLFGTSRFETPANIGARYHLFLV